MLRSEPRHRWSFSAPRLRHKQKIRAVQQPGQSPAARQAAHQQMLRKASLLTATFAELAQRKARPVAGVFTLPFVAGNTRGRRRCCRLINCELLRSEEVASKQARGHSSAEQGRLAEGPISLKSSWRSTVVIVVARFGDRCPTNFSLSQFLEKLKLIGHQN